MDRNTMGSKDEQMVQTSPGHMWWALPAHREDGS